MSQHDEEAQWERDRERERRGLALPRPVSKHKGMQADWAIDAMQKTREARDA
jgi:hypothetical protein